MSFAFFAGILALAFSGCPQPGDAGTTVYTVSFEANGGTPAPAAQAVAEGGRAAAPAAMTKTGHTFGGWYREAAFTTLWNFAADTVTANITLYAMWIPPASTDTSTDTFTVSFEADGGTPPPASQTVAGGCKATTPPAMTKGGFTFVAWYREDTFTTVWDFSTDTVTGNIALYAKWEAVNEDNWVVTWELNGGAWGSTTPVNQVVKGGTITEPAPPVKTGYTHDGWYSDSGLATVYDFNSAVTADITLYAKWAAITYTVVYDKNAADASGTTISSTHTYGEPKALTTNGFTRSGHTFSGWNTRSDGGGASYADGVSVENLSSTDGDTVTLYAKWDPVIYTVTFNANGGTPAPTAQTVAEGGKATEPAAMTKTGHTFVAWYRENTFATPWSFGTDMVTANITLYAKWEAVTYTVTFNANGGTPAPTAQTVAWGGKATAPGAMTKGGFTFGGWYKEQTLANQWDFTTGTVTADITLYAKWTWDMVSLSGVTIIGDAAYSGVFPAGRTVILSPFKIAKYETTYELWYEVKQWADGNGYTFANPGREGHDGAEGASPTAGAKTEPVTTISSRDVIVWCNAYSEMSGKEPVYYYGSAVIKDTTTDNVVMDTSKNGYRLPTEAEWEYAARGGGTPSTSGTFVYIYAGSNSVGDVAWYSGNSSRTHTVGTKAANTAGLYDMSGNVFEWCWDWYSSRVGTGTANNPEGRSAGSIRVNRGGSWYGDASGCAVARRHSDVPSYRSSDVGFRVACP
jgi:uncharacterized repeat protein (TIGR02543 family)